MEIVNPNEIQFNDESVFEIQINENNTIKLVIGNETYIETETEMFYYNKINKSFVSDEGILFIMNDDIKKIIEDAFNVVNRK